MRPLVLACIILASACSTHSNAMHMRERIIVVNNRDTRIEVRLGMTSSSSWPIGKVDPARTKSFALPLHWSEFTLIVIPFDARYDQWQQTWTSRLFLFSEETCIKVRVYANLGATSLMRC